VNKNDLVKSAELLAQVSQKSASEFASKRAHLVALMNAQMTSRPDVLELVGPGNVDVMTDNHANHALFLESIFNQHSPEILTDTVLWVFRVYQSRRFHTSYWNAQLATWIEIYKIELSPQCFTEIVPYYHWMLVHIPIFNQLSENDLTPPPSRLIPHND
jgi:hypothetical protein